jgi:hypothetical protein
MEDIGRTLIYIGLFITAMGFLIYMFDKLPFNLGRLPGDIYIKRDNFVFYFPLTSSLLISLILSLIFILISKISSK